MVKTAVAVFICLYYLYKTWECRYIQQPHGGTLHAASLSNTKEIAINRIGNTSYVCAYIEQPWGLLRYTIPLCMIPLIINHSSASALPASCFFGTTIAATPGTAPYIIALIVRLIDRHPAALAVNAFHHLRYTVPEEPSELWQYSATWWKNKPYAILPHINRMIDDFGEWFRLLQTAYNCSLLVPILLKI